MAYVSPMTTNASSGLPTPAQLRDLIDYNPQTGEMTWKRRKPDMFAAGEPGLRRARTPEHKCANWNAKNAGRPALASRDNKHGYLVGTIRQFRAAPFKAHRVAWAIHYGVWPENDVDHINGITSDNRIANLRDVSHAVNMRNMKVRSDNTSGHAGISWFAQTSRWHVRVPRESGTDHVGFFLSLEEAVAARDAARAGMGYTKRAEGDVVTTAVPKRVPRRALA